MSAIYSYVLRFDDGAAPNPFYEKCTLTICKPAIRRKAPPGSWVIGTGSKHSRCNDGTTHNFNGMLVYAMKVKEVMAMDRYDEYCRTQLPGKIPDKTSPDYRLHLGDAIYDYSKGGEPLQRKGQHEESERERDLSGLNALVSDQFYYFGENPILMPPALQRLVKKNQGHKIIDDPYLVNEFENWIAAKPSGLQSLPQLLFRTISNMENPDTLNCHNGCNTVASKKTTSHSHGSSCNV